MTVHMILLSHEITVRARPSHGSDHSTQRIRWARNENDASIVQWFIAFIGGSVMMGETCGGGGGDARDEIV